MKKVLSVVALSLFIALSASAQMPVYEYVPEIDKGKVKVLTRKSEMHTMQDGKEMYSADQWVFHFDKKGRITEIHTKHTYDGMLYNVPGYEYVTSYSYNKKGVLLSESSTNKGQEKPFRVITYTYDKKGREVARLYEDFHSPDATHMLYKTIYSNTGNKDEIISLASRSDGSFEEREKWQYKYDDQGREIERYYYDYETKRYWKDESRVYDKTTGKELEKYQYHTDGSIYTQTVYSYDSKGEFVSAKKTVNGEPEVASNLVPDFKDEFTYY